MKSFSAKRILLCTILAVLIGICIKIISGYHAKSGDNATTVQKKRELLPADVELVLKGYSYLETVDDLEINISGSQIVRRGKKLLGLRSNLVKTNFFQEIKGTITTPKSTVYFSAADAEWDTNPAHPLVLQKDVIVSKNNKIISGIKSARIFFRRGLIEVNADKTEVYTFK